MTEQSFEQPLQLSNPSDRLVNTAASRLRQGNGDLATMIHLAQTRIDNREYQQIKHEQLNRRYLQDKYSYDQQFIATHQAILSNSPTGLVRPSPKNILLNRLTTYFYQFRDQIIADFRREFSVKPPYNNPSSITILEYIFATHQKEIASFLGNDLSENLPKPFRLSELFQQYSYSQHFIPGRPVDLAEKESVMAFYGQLLASLTNLSSEELNDQRAALEEVRRAIPELPPRGNLSKISLQDFPDLLSALNIHAIQRFFQLRINQVDAQSEPLYPQNPALQHETVFSEFILKNYLHPHEYQDMLVAHQQFLQIPVSTAMDKLRKLVGKPTMRQNFLGQLPVSNDQQGVKLYNHLQIIDYLSRRAETIEKGDQPIVREIAFLFRLKLLENLPEVEFSDVQNITVNQLFL